jgi:hypothetical protein
MKPLLLLLFSCFSFSSLHSQTGYLFIKKNGKKKRTYTEGNRIQLQLHNGSDVKGLITLLRNDTIYINGKPVPRLQVSRVILNKKKKKPLPADGKTLLLITGGVVLTGVGLSLNDVETPEQAFITAAALGYGPLLVKHLFGRLIYALSRKQFRIGKKYRLQVLDFHIPRNRPF